MKLHLHQQTGVDFCLLNEVIFFRFLKPYLRSILTKLKVDNGRHLNFKGLIKEIEDFLFTFSMNILPDDFPFSRVQIEFILFLLPMSMLAVM